jgi:hypothetical protein
MRNKTNSEVSPPRIIGGILAVLSALLAVSAAVVNYSFRIGYVFMDHEVFEGFSKILFCAMALNGIYAPGFAAAVLAKKRIPFPVIVISCFSAFLSLLFWLINYIMSVEAYMETAFIIIPGIMPYLAALFGVPFLLLCYPNLKIPAKARNITSAVLSVIFAGTLGASAVLKAPPVVFAFLSQPVVFDIGAGAGGKEYYSVVFSTNADAQGYVTYTHKGVEKTVYANEAGMKAINRIHAVRIPRAELDGNTYTAHAARVLDRLAYGKLGRAKTIDTKAYTLKDTSNKTNPVIISASDWHGQLPQLKSAADYFRDEADLVIFNGDYADFYINEAQMIKYFLGGAHILTGGEIPGIFVRGNHEVRGNEKVEDIGLKIGLSKLYYQVERSACVFTILDSAEDVLSDRWEHDGFYDMAPYFNEQMDWFESLPVRNDAFNILLLHYKDFVTPRGDALYDTAAARFKAAANAFNIGLSISGDAHNWIYYREGGNGFNYKRLIDGGTYGGSVSRTLADIGLLRGVRLNGALRKFLRFIVLEKKLPLYRLSKIVIGDTNITFSYANNLGYTETMTIIK